MDRRSFLVSAGGAGLAALGGAAGFARWQEIAPHLHYPGRAEGHFLRDRGALPAASTVLETDVLILGSGVAGVSAAWKLGKEGARALMIDGPEAFGNAAGARYGDLECPTGAHYLPLPSMEATHLRAMLHDAGVITHGHLDARPTYDERFLVHAPEERLLAGGRWQDSMIPGAAPADLAEQRRFFAAMEGLRAQRGADGRRMFVFPSALSSLDPMYAALDRISFKDWLDREAYRSPGLHWYLNYCCRDDYGARYERISAWAGLHYFAGRSGHAANAEDAAVLTWPGGLAPLVASIAARSGIERRPGTAVSVRQSGEGVEALCFRLENGVPRTFLVRARKAICAMPLFVAARVVEGIARFGFDPKRDLPAYAPWLVANFVMKTAPREEHETHGDLPLAWDNVVQSEPGLGYVVSTHQDIRVQPAERSVFTAYVALSDRNPAEARAWMQKARPEELLALAGADLQTVYGWRLAPCVERVDITLRAHAMAIPAPGFRANAGLAALRELDGPILFAHADLSGFSVFEEASWWGWRTAEKALA
ncbi:NAD(P)/FAD-dependent oxidoreductase [Massilia sp. Leaf139]|uniref:NAD(P)-binding protein n=1 Tax=Massilia sp. Leaf139 TaxID=1736272 RepID=UPI0006FECB78|nr:NAD(P)/FAD-dependent oxidoreductase [Massilia sp. Leaf139]KQQ86844.1 amine oxidase [Massilia sp. Leaf139]